MSRAIDRRTFLKSVSSGAAGASTVAWLTPNTSANPQSATNQAKLRYAAIGVGGMGARDLERISSHPKVEVVALCDVDQSRFEAAKQHAPMARTFADYRKMLSEMDAEIDAVSVSTPDHMHAAISMDAMQRGMHVYCQKPLTRTVQEARIMAKRAKASGVVTQMGIQNHSQAPLNMAKALFDQEKTGPIHSGYVWTDRPAGWWAQNVQRPEGEDTSPPTLNWDLWLGIAPKRPFKTGAYHPFQWRGREDFGTGAQGDMACHLMDPAIWFLELGFPLSIRSEGPSPNGESFPLWSQVQYTFAPTKYTNRGPLHLTWLDGGRKPPVDLLTGLGTSREELPANGCLLVGEQGSLLADPYGKALLFPSESFPGIQAPTVEAKHHWHIWVDACLGEAEVNASFDYAAKLTEIALLGNVAMRFPHETLNYDAEKMQFPNRPEANVFLRPTIRSGWKIDSL